VADGLHSYEGNRDGSHCSTVRLEGPSYAIFADIEGKMEVTGWLNGFIFAWTRDVRLYYLILGVAAIAYFLMRTALKQGWKQELQPQAADQKQPGFLRYVLEQPRWNSFSGQGPLIL
jgi:hypothetical protein